ncbi:CPBP family intramembrane glutamic endopeptidase [Leucobacter massiliensis]|uniref:CPBP family intramembrane metalloprotease domain-containing protein n=1 Tax=Leucobacter massiliensis TaxID=1686285 RepID=A0A2S9QS52_9MICO|nr:type II CAAX endopeptidase family protein [Leucobacter massiliensis]PRI12427.1 CPBP family intramembrane metalloprotease domain-containing protein [Leucobacter massiliensis]
MTSTGSEQHEPPQPAASPMPGQMPGPASPGQGAAGGHGVPGAGAPANWAWAQPAMALQTVETEPLEYHRLLRGVAGYRWWKPLLLLLLSGVYFGVFTVIVSLAFIPLLALSPDYLEGVMTGSGEMLDTQVPISVLLSLVSIIIMMPAVILAMLSLGMRPVGRIWSVAARIRWGLLGRLSVAALLAVVVMNVVGIAFGMALSLAGDPASLSETAPAPDQGFDWAAAWTSLVIVVLLVPLQATAEEVVFRGLFMQVIGSWLRSPWFGILIPSLGFALLHIYDVWGLLSVGLLGVVAAWLTWRTGGLEAAIAIHVINNLIAFGFMTFAFGGETAQVEESGGPGTLLGALAGYAVFIWLTLRTFRRHGYGRTRIDLMQVPVPAAAPTQPPSMAELPQAMPGSHPAPAPQPGAPAAQPGAEVPAEAGSPDAGDSPDVAERPSGTGRPEEEQRHG